MGVRAVIVVRDDTGRYRRFWAAWASKQYQIPHLARFIHTTDEGTVPLSVAGYLAYTATHPGTLPAQDITGEGWYADPDDVGDLDHRYELELHSTERTFRYLVHDRIHHRGNGRAQPGWRRSEELPPGRSCTRPRPGCAGNSRPTPPGTPSATTAPCRPDRQLHRTGASRSTPSPNGPHAPTRAAAPARPGHRAGPAVVRRPHRPYPVPPHQRPAPRNVPGRGRPDPGRRRRRDQPDRSRPPRHRC